MCVGIARCHGFLILFTLRFCLFLMFAWASRLHGISVTHFENYLVLAKTLTELTVAAVAKGP